MFLVERRLMTALAASAILVTVAACTPPESSTAPAAGAPREVAYTAFCNSYIDLNTGLLDSPLFGDDAEVKAKGKDVITAAAKKMRADVLDLKSKGPSDLIASFDQVIKGLDKVVDSGDATTLQADLANASQPVDQWAYDHCGWNQVAFSATNYKYEGLPATFPAGKTAFKLSNKTADTFHVMVVARKQPGVTGTGAEIFAKGGDPMASDLKMVAAIGAEPGKDGITAADLTPGEYVVFCPIPVGQPAPGAPPGKSHATMGELQDVTVK